MDPFKHRVPDEEQVVRIQALREAYYALLLEIHRNTKFLSWQGHYINRATEALEESAMWAIKSVVFEND
jgi:hypothetical protein